MATPKEQEINLKSVTVDGVTFYVIEDKDEAEALVRSARSALFMSELQRRGQKVLMIGGSVAALLFFLSQWWGPIDTGMRALFKVIPNG